MVVGAVTVLTAGVGTTVLAGTLAGAVIHGAAVGALVGAGVGVVGGAVVGGVVSGWTVEGILTGIGIGFGVGAIVGAVIGGALGYMNYVPSQITGFTKHGINQIISRNGHGVADKALLETMKAPSKIVKQGIFRSTYKYVGKNAVVILNKTGKVVTAWAKSRLGRRFGIGLLWLGLDSLYEN